MNNVQLSNDQQEVSKAYIKFLLSSSTKEMVITGAAGTGKSVLVKHLLKVTEQHSKMCKYLLESFESEIKVILTSTTNKAADVLAQATGQSAITIHKALGLQPHKNYQTGQESLRRRKTYPVLPKQGIIFIDEASMCDSELLKAIREYAENLKIVFIGDSFQLPPVKETVSPVFDPKICSNVHSLTTVHRQAVGNPIIKVASEFRQAVLTGDLPEHITPYGETVQVLNDHDFKQTMEDLFDVHSPMECKVTAWTNHTIQKYNSHIRTHLKGNAQPEIGEYFISNTPIIKNRELFVQGDAIVRLTSIGPTETHHDLTGRFVSLNNSSRIFWPDSLEDVAVALREHKRLKDWPEYFYLKESFADLRYPYASTVHKAQGSTYHTVLIDTADMCNNFNRRMVARLMYTAITRASDRVIFRGNMA